MHYLPLCIQASNRLLETELLDHILAMADSLESPGSPGSPIPLFRVAQFRNDSDSSDNEECTLIVDMGLRIRPSFLPSIPVDMAQGIIWEMLIVEDDVTDKYRTCTVLHCDCRGWRNFVDYQQH